jgi:hypothetical protein
MEESELLQKTAMIYGYCFAFNSIYTNPPIPYFTPMDLEESLAQEKPKILGEIIKSLLQHYEHTKAKIKYFNLT